MSVATIATMTLNIGKKLLIQELNLNFFVERVWNSDNHSSRGNAAVETARRGLTTEISFEITFLWSPKLFPEVSHLQK